MTSIALKKCKPYEIIWTYDFQEIKALWEDLGREDNYFLSGEFIRAIDAAPPKGSRSLYCVLTIDGRVVGRCYSQLVDVHMIQSLNIDEQEKLNLWANVYRKFRTKLSRTLQGTLLCFGHLLLSGNRGIEFAPEIGDVEQALLIQDMAICLHNGVNKQQKVIVVLVKDLKSTHRFEEKNSLSCQYSELNIPPSMSLDIEPDWKSLEDYLASFKSKYRVRVKKAKKRAVDLRFEPMTQLDIIENEAKINEMYLKIANQASFNLFELNDRYFSTLKAGLGDRLRVYGIWDGAELVGFYSSIKAYSTLEAHFLGYDPSAVKQYDIYLNILIRLVEEGIREKMDNVYFARTAHEIKSSIGAKPIEYCNYLRHKQILPNQLVPLFLKNLVPQESYELRNPFKQEELVNS